MAAAAGARTLAAAPAEVTPLTAATAAAVAAANTALRAETTYTGRVSVDAPPRLKANMAELQTWCTQEWGAKMGTGAKSVCACIEAIDAHMESLELKQVSEMPEGGPRQVVVTQRPAFDHVVFFIKPESQLVYSVSTPQHVEQMTLKGYKIINMVHINPSGILPDAVETSGNTDDADLISEADADADTGEPQPTDVMQELRFGSDVPNLVKPSSDSPDSYAQQIVNMFEAPVCVGEATWSPLYMWTKEER